MPKDDEIKHRIFDGRDYKIWKKRVLLYLRCKKCEEPDTREKMNTDARDNWDEKNPKAILGHVICSYLDTLCKKK